MPITVLRYRGPRLGPTSRLQILKLLSCWATARLTVRGATIAVPKFTKESRGTRANSREDVVRSQRWMWKLQPNR
ncbi:hypothetical protein BDR05DRAFT_955011 [Suillus weaverae]|nr:hypothetical protein BDR05DRAFT_955011 [Suillus weaverae]